MKILRMLSVLEKLSLNTTATILLLFTGLNLFGKSAEFTPVDRWYEVYLGDAPFYLVSQIVRA